MMFAKRKIVYLFATGLLLTFSFFVFHTIEHHHSHELQEKECPICHFGVDIALPAVLTLALTSIPTARCIVVASVFNPTNLIDFATTPKRAPPVAI